MAEYQILHRASPSSYPMGWRQLLAPTPKTNPATGNTQSHALGLGGGCSFGRDQLKLDFCQGQPLRPRGMLSASLTNGSPLWAMWTRQASGDNDQLPIFQHAQTCPRPDIKETDGRVQGQESRGRGTATHPREAEHPSLRCIVQMLPEELPFCSHLAGPCASLGLEMDI